MGAKIQAVSGLSQVGLLFWNDPGQNASAAGKELGILHTRPALTHPSDITLPSKSGEKRAAEGQDPA